MDLSIILIGYNNASLVKSCLKGLIQHTQDVSYEIILVDNNSDENMEESLVAYKDHIKIINNSSNAGFGVANNIGMSQAQGDFFLLLNADTVITDNVIGKAYTHFQSLNENVGLMGIQLQGVDGSLQKSQYQTQELPTFRTIWYDNILIAKLFPKTAPSVPVSNEVQDSDCIIGAFMFLRKGVFEKTQGFDSDFFLYFEEIEWCQRIKKAGYQIKFNPSLRITHIGASGIESIKRSRQIYLSYGLYFLKQYGLLGYLLSAIMVHLNIISNLFIGLFSSTDQRKKALKKANWYLPILFPWNFSVIKYAPLFRKENMPSLTY